MSDMLAATLERVSRVPGVRAAVIVEADAGVPVVTEAAAGVSATALAALGAALFQRTSAASGAAGFGALRACDLEAEGGHVLVAGTGDLIIVVLVERDAQLGRVRLEAHRAAEALR